MPRIGLLLIVIGILFFGLLFSIKLKNNTYLLRVALTAMVAFGGVGIGLALIITHALR